MPHDGRLKSTGEWQPQIDQRDGGRGDHQGWLPEQSWPWKDHHVHKECLVCGGSMVEGEGGWLQQWRPLVPTNRVTKTDRWSESQQQSANYWRKRKIKVFIKKKVRSKRNWDEQAAHHWQWPKFRSTIMIICTVNMGHECLCAHKQYTQICQVHSVILK